MQMLSHNLIIIVMALFFDSIIQGLSRGQEARTLQIFLHSIDPTCPYDMIFCIDYLLMYLRHF